jgi:hypothetical protein
MDWLNPLADEAARFFGIEIGAVGRPRPSLRGSMAREAFRQTATVVVRTRRGRSGFPAYAIGRSGGPLEQVDRDSSFDGARAGCLRQWLV